MPAKKAARATKKKTATRAAPPRKAARPAARKSAKMKDITAAPAKTTMVVGGAKRRYVT